MLPQSVAAVIPAFNEEEGIARVVREVQEYIHEVIVVDDGSTDRSAELAEKAGAQVICHPMNLGKGAAFQSGVRLALKQGAEWILTLDGDGQHDPKDIPHFLERAKSSPNSLLILGNRMGETHSMPWLRYWTNKTLSYLISKLAGQSISDSQCGYRLIHREILNGVVLKSKHFDTESEILVQAARSGYEISEIRIKTIYGVGFSKINKFWDSMRFFKFYGAQVFRLLKETKTK